VLEIADPPPPVLVPSTDNTGRVSASRRTAAPITPQVRLRVVRLSVGDVLTGVDTSQKEIEILTGFGGGDCGYQFQVGIEYVIYAYKNSAGRLETGICSRTRPLAEAADDVKYIREMATAPETGELRVRTAFPGIPGQSGATIIAEGQGQRDVVIANGAGEAVFNGLRAGEYTIHVASDGDLPDDPKVQLRGKGCLDVSLFRVLRITGRVVTRTGAPASRIQVQFRSTDNKFGDGSMMTDADGNYELRILRPGEYHLGINLNGTATKYSPYPRWLHPGTEDSAAATKIDFSGRPETRVYDLILPDPLPERTVDGVVVRADGQPAVRSVVTAFDAFRNVVAQAFTDPSGHFVMRLFVEIPYQLLAVIPGPEAVSAPPVDIQPGSSPLSLHLTLSQPGNSAYDVMRGRR
jgi:Carboxypeptidase regulatory-like domain